MSSRPHSLADACERFRDAMRDEGIETPDPIDLDGEFRRIHVEGDRPGTRNGWYVGYFDSVPAGAFGYWRRGIKATWCARDWRTITDVEREQVRKRTEQAKADRSRALAAQAEKRRSQLNRTWGESVPLDHPDAEPVLRYLDQRLGGHNLDPWPKALRCRLNLPYYETAKGGRKVGEYPSMIAMVTGPTGVPVTLHRTYLEPDGTGKATVPSPKKIMGVPFPKTITGAAIRLCEPAERLAVAEGIETASSVYVATQEPVWAAISAHGLASVVIPATVREVLIYADCDESGVGQRAGEILRLRLQAEGRTVSLFIPPEPGDFNDELLRE